MKSKQTGAGLQLQSHGKSIAGPRSGMTVLELLVVVGIVAVLLSLVMPAIQRTRESARRVQCTANLRELGLALHNAHDLNMQLPAGWSEVRGTSTAWGWASEILPQLDQSALFENLQRQTTIDAQANDIIRSASLPVMICPSDLIPKTFTLYAGQEHDDDDVASIDGLTETPLVELPSSNYVGVFGDSDPDDVDGQTGSGTFVARRALGWKDLTQGLSHVMIVSERTARKLPSTWLGVRLDGEDAQARLTGFAGLGPNRQEADECELDSRHDQLINVLFADGHVQPVSDDVDQFVYRKMARRNP